MVTLPVFLTCVLDSWLLYLLCPFSQRCHFLKRFPFCALAICVIFIIPNHISYILSSFLLGMFVEFSLAQCLCS